MNYEGLDRGIKVSLPGYFQGGQQVHLSCPGIRRTIREITCERCGIKFYKSARGRGRTKYCLECGAIVEQENSLRASLRARHKRKTLKEVKQ